MNILIGGVVLLIVIIFLVACALYVYAGELGDMIDDGELWE